MYAFLWLERQLLLFTLISQHTTLFERHSTSRAGRECKVTLNMTLETPADSDSGLAPQEDTWSSKVDGAHDPTYNFVPNALPAEGILPYCRGIMIYLKLYQRHTVAW